MLGSSIPTVNDIGEDGILIAAKYSDSSLLSKKKLALQSEFENRLREKEAVWWRNACVLYFQTFSKLPIADGFERPNKFLEYYQSLEFTYAPGN